MFWKYAFLQKHRTYPKLMNFKINELILRLANPPSLPRILYSPIYFITINIFAIHGFGSETFIQQVWSKHRKISCFQIDTFPPKCSWRTDWHFEIFLKSPKLSCLKKTYVLSGNYYRATMLSEIAYCPKNHYNSSFFR